MVTDGAQKLDNASVIFVDLGVKIGETYLNSLSTVAAYYTQGL